MEKKLSSNSALRILKESNDLVNESLNNLTTTIEVNNNRNNMSNLIKQLDKYNESFNFLKVSYEEFKFLETKLKELTQIGGLDYD